MARRQLPISQRHRKGCTRSRDCDCPWRPRVRIDGQFRGRTWDTWAEAEQEYHELMAQRPEPLADRTTTIAQWAQRWQAMGAAQWRPGTVRMYRYTVSNHITPRVGHFKVTELRRDDVRLWVAAMRRDGVSPGAMSKAVETLHAMYGEWLKSDRLLPRGNPVDLGVAPKPARKEFTSPTAERVAAWAARMPPEMALMVTTEAFYGARISEIRALRDEDIIFNGKDMGAPLAPQLARLAALPESKYESRRPQLRFQRKLEHDRTPGPIKNERRGVRTLPFPQWLAAAYAVQLEKWPPVDGWLFTCRTAVGGYGRIKAAHPRPLSYWYCWDKYTRAARAAGIILPPGQLTHALRHHCVSVLRDKGWSDQAIGYWIGDTAQTVAAVYGRPTGDAMDRIAAMLSAGRDVPPLRAVD